MVKAFSAKGLVPDSLLDPRYLTAVALGATATVGAATRIGMPISTTHAILGGLAGAGWIVAGRELDAMALLRGFALPLLLSPLLAVGLAAGAILLGRRADREVGPESDACLCVSLTEPAAPAQGAMALRGAAAGIRGHHERWDGDGYPDRIAADDIPRHARIVAVCDAFDAMAHSRHYREGMGAERALAILREHAGSQWDPEVVTVVCEIVDRDGASTDEGALASVGRDERTEAFCGCADALPAGVSS